MAFTIEHSLRCAKDFPALNRVREDGLKLSYLDGPGGSQVPQAVIDAMVDFYGACNVNTHGHFPPSIEVDRRMRRARNTNNAPRTPNMHPHRHRITRRMHPARNMRRPRTTRRRIRHRIRRR